MRHRHEPPQHPLAADDGGYKDEPPRLKRHVERTRNANCCGLNGGNCYAINRRKPGALHHLAFRAESRAEVDRLHSELKGIGATIVSPPREYPEYTPPGYYALFFKDPEGIKYEIVCTKYDGV